MKIVVPMAGQPRFYPGIDHKFSRSFVEVAGKPMIEIVIDNLKTISSANRFVFIVNEEDVRRLLLDNVLRMLTNENCDIVTQSGLTKGAICSLLLGITHLDCDEPILISNADQIFSTDLNRAIRFFSEQECDAGVVTFNSVHPQWSYARVVEEDQIVEAAEKRPISQHAIAGLYFFRTGKLFLKAAMAAVEKERSQGGLYYTSLALNELILDGRKLVAFEIPSDSYHSFYSPQKIKEYETWLASTRRTHD